MTQKLLFGICLGVMMSCQSVWAAQISTNKNSQNRKEHSLYRQLLSEEQSAEKAYADFKKHLSDKTGITYSLDVSFLGQRAAPNGKGTPWQTQYYGTANWDMFQSDTWGSGSFQIAYTAVRYWGQSAQGINNRVGLISAFNDYTTNANYFDQLSYTHQLAGDFSPFSITIGQFPMYNFDGGSYDANQQINFLNFALSQNASSTYPSASLGGYVTFAPNEKWNVSVGIQDANNISGATISTHKFGKGRYTSFGSVTYSPVIEGLGASSFSFMIYNQPGVSIQPQASNGWSINMQQEIGKKWAIFGRINGASHSSETIKQSYVLGMVMNNPLGRNALDQIGLAGAVNKLNKAVNGHKTRAVENVLEAYWA